MIDDHNIVVGIVATNLVENGYYPCSFYSMCNLASIEFVDKLLCANGCSTDNTVELHNTIEKVEFFNSDEWNTDNLTQVAFEKQLSCILREVNLRYDKAILLICFADNFVHDDFVYELHDALTKFIQTDDANFMPLPIAKMYTRSVRENQRKLPNKFNVSAKLGAIKFNERFRWHTITNREQSLIGSSDVKLFQYRNPWTNEFLSYENWFFTKEHYDRKRIVHEGWNNMPSNMSHELCIKRKYLGRRKGDEGKGVGIRRVHNFDEHPKHAQKMFEQLEPKHFGYNFFDIDLNDRID